MDEMGFNVYTMLCSKIYFSLECLRLSLSGTLHLRAEIAKAIDSFSEFYNGNAPTPYEKSPSFIWEANFENSIKKLFKNHMNMQAFSFRMTNLYFLYTNLKLVYAPPQRKWIMTWIIDDNPKIIPHLPVHAKNRTTSVHCLKIT